MTPAPLDNLVSAALQAGLIALAGAPLPRLFGIWSPRARLLYWRSLMVLCVMLPLLAPRAIVQAAPAGAPAQVSADSVSVVGAAPAVGGPGAAGASAWLDRMPRFEPGQILVSGVLVRALWLVLGLAMLTRLRRGARRFWPRPPAVEEAVVLTGCDAEFLLSASAVHPMTFGFVRPVVLVPADFTDFTSAQQKAIACHELLHVRRLDWLRTAADELIRTLAWFHPAAWWLTGQVHLAREQLVDQEVVRHLGVRRPYLDALLHLASSERRGALFPATPFLGRAHLPQRVELLVKEVRMSRRRLVLSFAAIAVVLTLCGHAAVAAFPLRAGVDVWAVSDVGQGAARPGIALASTEPVTVRMEKAAVKDALNLLGQATGVTFLFDPSVGDPGPVTFDLEKVTLQAALNTITEASGLSYQVQDPKTIVVFRRGVAPAPGQARPSVPAPMTRATTALRKIRDVRPAFPPGSPAEPLVLEVVLDHTGRASEVTTVVGSSDLGSIASAAVEQWELSAPPKASYKLLVGFNPAAGTNDPQGQPPVLVGGNVKAPVKVRNVRPIYPKDAQEARVQGVVILETRIDSDGAVSEARILRSIPMLDRAALEAVLQWKYTPPGFPLQMTVTCNFTLSDSAGVGVGSGVGGGVSGAADRAKAMEEELAKARAAAGTTFTDEGYVRVGGNLEAPTKVKDVKPVYPDAALNARVQGVVIAEIKVGPDGRVQDARILRSIALLDKAALEAVMQWEYTPTLLNGAPIGVIMTVTVNFTLE